MKKRFKVVNAATAMCMFLSLVLAGCGGAPSSNSTKPGETSKSATPSAAVTVSSTPADPDISKEVNLKGYLLGSAPTGFNDVMTKVNEKLKADINATMEIAYIGWADLGSKYPLILASGEDVDWIYTAGWCYYSTQASKGAFFEITEDMYQQYMPQHYAKLKDSTAFKEVKINGRMYMIPTSTPDKKTSAFIYREDLRKKYNIPEINKFSDIEPYLEAIKKNEPDMIPMNLDSQYDLGTALGNLMADNGLWVDIGGAQGGFGVYYDFEDPEGKLIPISDESYSSLLKSNAKTVKKWYDAGYINRNVFNNQVRSKESFEQGKSAVGFGNTIDLQANISNSTAQGYEVAIVPVVSGKTGHSGANSYLNNGFAIAANTKNADRVMMAFDKIMEDKEYIHLVYFGIEGTNYVVKDGKISLPEGLTSDKNTYPPDAAGFWFVNKDYFEPMESWTPQYIELQDKMDQILVPDTYSAFAPVTDNVKTEVANVQQVFSQYFQPIAIGAVQDIDAAFNTLTEKLKAAGQQKILDEMTTQTKAFLDAQN